MRFRSKVTVYKNIMVYQAAEELAALEAIYRDDIQIDDDRHGFSLRVLPHPAELQENLVSTVLCVRCDVTVAASC